MVLKKTYNIITETKMERVKKISGEEMIYIIYKEIVYFLWKMLTVQGWMLTVQDWMLTVQDWMLTVQDWTLTVQD